MNWRRDRDGKEFQLNRIYRWKEEGEEKKEEEVGRKNQKGKKLETKKTNGRKRKKRELINGEDGDVLYYFYGQEYREVVK